MRAFWNYIKWQFEDEAIRALSPLILGILIFCLLALIEVAIHGYGNI